jgi:hypothetical protein
VRPGKKKWWQASRRGGIAATGRSTNGKMISNHFAIKPSHLKFFLNTELVA